MFKNLIYTLFSIFITLSIFGQGSENLIPKEAVVVFSINNTDLLNKISLDKMIQYEFMEEIQSELFHSDGITLKQSGIDFDQRINFFNGKTVQYEVSGITMGIKNENQILKVFNNFESIHSHIDGVEVFRNDLNYLFIKGNQLLVVRIEPENEQIKSEADSIWKARGNYQFFDPDYTSLDGIDSYQEDGEYDNSDGGAYPEDSNAVNAPKVTDLPDDTLNEGNDYEQVYWDLRDSVRYELQQSYIRQMSTDLFIHHQSLYQVESAFQQQLTKKGDAIFFFDNARNLDENKGIWQFKSIFPILYSDDKSLYDGNIITGELNLIKNNIQVTFGASYGKELGEIYSDLTKAKFVNDFKKYIYKDALGYFTYNVNLKKSFQTSYDVVMNRIQSTTDKETLMKVLLAEVIHEFVDIDNIFNTYQGSMFGSVNGYLSVKTTYVDYRYDEETFEYTEKEIDTVKDIPNFNIGFKTDNATFLNRIVRVIAKTFPDKIINHGTYYEVKDALLNTIPGYFAVVNDLFIFSVDENLFTTHLNGYAKSEQIDIRKAKKSRLTYLYLDIDKTIAKLPREALSDRQNEMINTMVDKSGILELKTISTSKKETRFELNLSFKNTDEDSGVHLLDLINSLFILSKK